MDKNINKNKMITNDEVDEMRGGDKAEEFAETVEERPEPLGMAAAESISEPATQESGQAVKKYKGWGKKKKKDDFDSQKESHGEDEDAKKNAEDVINRYKEMLDLKELREKTKEKLPNTIGEKCMMPVEAKIATLQRKIVQTNEEVAEIIKETQLIQELKRLRFLNEEQQKFISSAVSRGMWNEIMHQELLWELKDFKAQLKVLEERKNQDSLSSSLAVDAPVTMSDPVTTPQVGTAVKKGRRKKKKSKVIAVTEIPSTSSKDPQLSTTMTRATETEKRSPPSQSDSSMSSNKLPTGSKHDSFEPEQDSLDTASERNSTAPADLTTEGSNSIRINPPWWSEEIAQLRRVKVCKRRKYTHLGRRRLGTDEEKAENRRLAYQEYRLAKKAFEEAVTIAKLISKSSNEENISKETV